MKKFVKYSPEVMERAVRLVFEARAQSESQWAAMVSIAAKIGCTAETLRRWYHALRSKSPNAWVLTRIPL